MKFAFKITILSIGYFFLLILESSCCGDCPDEVYFDYNQIGLTTHSERINSSLPDNKLEIVVRPDNGRFVTDNHPPIALLNKSAWACKCDQEGDHGDKFNISYINIFTDVEFNDSTSANSSLNHLFEIVALREYQNKQVDTIKLDLDSLNTPFNLRFGDWSSNTGDRGQIVLKLKENAQHLNQPYRFTIELAKSDGSIIRNQTGEVFWY